MRKPREASEGVRAVVQVTEGLGATRDKGSTELYRRRNKCGVREVAAHAVDADGVSL